MRSRRSRRSGSTLPACSRRSSSRSTGGSGWRSSRRRGGGPEGRRRCAGRPAVRDRRRRRGGAGDGLRPRRDLPAGDAAPAADRVDASAAASPTIHVSAGRRGLEIELPAADLVRLTARCWRRSPAAADRSAGDLRPLGPQRGDDERRDEPDARRRRSPMSGRAVPSRRRHRRPRPSVAAADGATPRRTGTT